MKTVIEIGFPAEAWNNEWTPPWNWKISGGSLVSAHPCPEPYMAGSDQPWDDVDADHHMRRDLQYE